MILTVRAVSILAPPVTREALGRNVGDDIHLPVRQRCDRYLRLRYIPEHDLVNRRLVIAVSIAGILLQYEPLTAYPLFELIRARPECQFVGLGSAQTIIGGLVRDEALCQAEDQGGIRTLGTQSDSVGI